MWLEGLTLLAEFGLGGKSCEGASILVCSPVREPLEIRLTTIDPNPYQAARYDLVGYYQELRISSQFVPTQVRSRVAERHLQETGAALPLRRMVKYHLN